MAEARKSPKERRREAGRAAPRILVTNDDGINAPGLKTLEKIAKELSDDVWVVAPETEQSGASHSLTLTLPLRLRKIRNRRYAVQGTPTDCVMLAVMHILADDPPDLVLSGINRGGNLADDVTYSGTIAAAMEGTALGIPSIALSQVIGEERNENKMFRPAAHHGARIVQDLLDERWSSDVLININFPPGEPEEIGIVEVTRQGTRDQSAVLIDARVDARNTPYYWLGFRRVEANPAKGTDLRAIFSRHISITPLHLNLTHESARRTLTKSMDTVRTQRGSSRGKKN